MSSIEIEIRIIRPHEYQQVLDFLRVHYYLEEPLTMGSEPKQQDKEDEAFNMSNIHHGTCLVAVKKSGFSLLENIVGVLLAGPKGSDEAEHLFKEAATFEASKWGRILKFLAYLEQEANIFKRFNVRNVLHVHVIGVKNEMRGHNIGCRLIEELLNLAKQLNHDMVSVDCTSFYSANLFERMGFQCVNVKCYKDYVDETGKQVFNPGVPHECVKTFVFKF